MHVNDPARIGVATEGTDDAPRRYVHLTFVRNVKSL